MSAADRRPGALTAHPTDPGVQHVVLGTNGDAAAEAAVRWIADRARAHVLDLDVVEVEAPGLGEIEPENAGPDGPASQVRQHLALHAPSVRATARTEAGDRFVALVDASRAADLLVLGTRRRSTGSPHLVASFATRVAEAAACPTVVVPTDWQPSAGPVVVGVEGDGSDTAAIDFAAREAAALHRDLVLVHAWRLITVVAPVLEVDERGDAIAHAAAARLDVAAKAVRARHPSLRVVRVLERGDAIDALVRAGRGAALLVVGTHALTFVDRLLLRSVSRAVLERPACPVAIVPGTSDPARSTPRPEASGA